MTIVLALSFAAGVPLQGSPILGAVAWMTGTLLGTVATTLCVVAVAAIGFMMLTGRVPFRWGMRVVLGCFVLLGAPVIAAAFTGVASRVDTPPPAPPPPVEDNPHADLPPATYDPYAGASLRPQK